jgi:excisionase family DNA binding protein
VTKSRLTPREVAQWLGLGSNTETVLVWIRSGQLPALNVARKPNGRARYRVDAADLEAFEKRRRVHSQVKVSQQHQARKRVDGVIEFF